MSFKKSVGWADLSINPIKGRCLGECWYCYYSGPRGIMNRFRIDPAIRFDLSVFENIPKKAKRIFLCSTHEMFGDWIAKDWRDQIFEAIQYRPDLTFIILTKMPERIDRPMPDNVWLGVSITQDSEYVRKAYLMEQKAKIRFISYEPIIDFVSKDIMWSLDWVILGRLTGYGKRNDPDRATIEKFVDHARYLNIPIFLKNNLKEIWGEPLIQEFPSVKTSEED